MVYTLDEIARRIRPVAEQYKLKAVYVFGSYARGEAREDSDVDLLIDDAGAGFATLLELGGLYCDLEDALNKEISLVTVDSLEQPIHHKSDVYFQENVRRERREVYVVA